jgi:hypothetical protein
LLKLHNNGHGYFLVTFSEGNKKSRYYIHRLVLMAFKPIKHPELFQCNHIDGNKKNNCVDNLEWCTCSENHLHAFKTGLKLPLKGENHIKCKLSEKNVLEIQCMLKERFLTQKEIGRIFGVTCHHISRIKLGLRRNKNVRTKDPNLEK